MLEQLFMQIGTRQNAFPLMRLLLPQLDTDRNTYGLKESQLAKTYVKAMGLAEHSRDALRLTKYKVPRNAMGRRKSHAGNFTEILYEVLLPRSAAKSDVTVGGVNELLDRLHRAHKGEAKARVLMDALTTMTARMQMWLARIVLKDLKIGMSESTILPAFHPEAEAAFQSCAKLRRVCEAATDPREISKLVDNIVPFQHLKPMLCAKVPWEQMVSRVGNGDQVIVEYKYDGERVLIHKKDGDFRMFTRRGYDVSNKYSYASFRTWIEQALRGVDNCIVDGEFLAWDREAGAYAAFGSNRPAAREEMEQDIGEQKVQLCYVAFDVLFLNDENLIKEPLYRRREVLSAIVHPIKNRFQVIEQKIATSNADVMDLLDHAMSKKMEGVIVKNYSSPYEVGGRTTNWVKLKPDYVNGMNDTLDLLILGGYYADGKRRGGGLSTFLLGVAKIDPGAPSGTRPTEFYTFGKVGTGYDMAELGRLRSHLGKYAVDYNRDDPPPHLMGWKPEASDVPDKWFPPDKSVVLELKLAELVPCTRDKFLTCITARFPRTQRIRWDKPWYECETMHGLRQIHQKCDGAMHRANAGLIARRAAKREAGAAGGRKRAKRAKTEPGVSGGLPERRNVPVKSRVFSGKEFCVVNGSGTAAPRGQRYSKQDLETLILEHGGTIVATEGTNTTALIYGKKTLRIELSLGNGNHDIVHWSWVIECVDRKALVPYREDQALFLTPATKANLKHQRDRFGDPFYVDTTREELERVLASVTSADVQALQSLAPTVHAGHSQLPRALRLYDPFDQSRLLSKYAKLCFYDVFVDSSATKIERDLLQDLLELHGARVSSSLHDKVTHVVVGSACSDARLNAIFDRLKEMRESDRRVPEKHVVRKAWVLESAQSDSPVDEAAFHVVPKHRTRRSHRKSSKKRVKRS